MTCKFCKPGKSDILLCHAFYELDDGDIIPCIGEKDCIVSENVRTVDEFIVGGDEL